MKIKSTNNSPSRTHQPLLLDLIKNEITNNNYSGFCQAIQNNERALIQELLSLEAIKEHAYVPISNIIRIAKETKDSDWIKTLLSIKQVRHQAHFFHNFLLHAAVSLGQPPLLKELLSIAKVRKKAATKKNASLRLAVICNNFELVKILLDIKEVKDLADMDNNALLEFARQNHNIAIVDALLAIKKVKYKDKINRAIAKGHFSKLREFIRQNDFEKYFTLEHILLLANHEEAFDIIKKILTFKAIQNQAHLKSNFLLHWAIKNRHDFLINELILLEKVAMKAQATTETLAFAVKKGNTELVKTLLSKEKICRQVHFNNNQILCIAIDYGHAKIVKELLLLKNVSETVPNKNNFLLKKAIAYGDCETVEALIAVDAVQRSIKNYDFLYQTASKNQLEMLLTLLRVNKIRQYASFKHNDLLHWAIKMDYSNLALDLLSINEVKKSVADQDNAALYLSVMYRRMNVVKALLAIETVKNTAHECDNKILSLACQLGDISLVKALLNLDLVRINLTPKSVLKILSSETCANLEASDIAIKEKSPVNFDWVNLLLQVLGKPPMALSPLVKSVAFSQVERHLMEPFWLATPYGLARSICHAYDDYLSLKDAADLETHEANRESSMDETLIAEINDIFIKKIKPAFIDTFEALGIDLASRLNRVEHYIKCVILNQIETIAEYEKDEVILTFIRKHHQNILSNEQLARQASQLFSSHTNSAHIAWRCYDRFALNIDSRNLFVPSNMTGNNTPILTILASPQRPLSLKEASELVRERAAYYALVIAKEPDKEKNQTMKKDLIFYLAEIKRAHSKEGSQEDVPSCFPGVLSRLGLSIFKSSQFGFSWVSKKKSLTSILCDKVIDGFLKTLEKNDPLQKIFPECSGNHCELAEKLIDAISGMGLENAHSMFINKDYTTNCGFAIEHYTHAHAKARELLLYNILSPNQDDKIHPSFDNFLLQVQDQLQQTDTAWFITPVDRAYVVYFLTALSEPKLTQRIGDLYAQKFASKKATNHPVSTLSPFEIQIQSITQFLNCTPEKKLSLETRRQKLIMQNEWFKKIKAAKFSSNYSDDCLIEIVEALTCIPETLQLPVLYLWYTQEKKPQTTSFFFADSQLWKPILRLTSKTKKELEPYIQELKSCLALKDLLEPLLDIKINLEYSLLTRACPQSVA